MIKYNKNKQQETGHVGFFEKLGIKDIRSLVLLGILYAFCWLIIIICNFFGDEVVNVRIPTPFVYATAAFPVVFFAFCILFWGLNSFFPLMFRRLSFPLFTILCIVLWLLWTYGNTLACLYLTTGLWNGWGRMIPIALMLIIAGYAGVHVRVYYMFEKARSYRCFRLLHLLLFLLSAAGFSLYGSYNYSLFFDSLIGAGNAASVFCLFALMQLVIYCLITLLTPRSMALELQRNYHKLKNVRMDASGSSLEKSRKE